MSDSERFEPVEFEVDEVLASTDKALLCRFGKEQVWLPRSQMRDGTDVEEKGDSGPVVIPRWLAEEKGLA